jgi:RHS repeat-associated protein
VGGLLAVVPAGATAHYAAYDGNGNVVGLVQSTDGTLSARYEYGPFGEPVRVSGPMAGANPFRWSTKYTDEETDLVYYGHRYYTASTGRWPSHDPIDEEGGANLYAFARNDSLNRFDILGLAESKVQGCVGTCGKIIDDWILEEIKRKRHRGCGLFRTARLRVKSVDEERSTRPPNLHTP